MLVDKYSTDHHKTEVEDDGSLELARKIVRLVLVQAERELAIEKHEELLKRERKIFISGLYPRDEALAAMSRVTESVRQLQQKKLQAVIQKQELLAEIQRAACSKTRKAHVGRHGLSN